MFFSKSFIAISLAVVASALGVPMVARDAKADLKAAVLADHNAARAAYGAKALTWNEDLYAGTLSWANACQFKHSGGNYGENLYASTGQGGDPIKSAVDSWMSEACMFLRSPLAISYTHHNNPVFSSDTGHFTQVVWKSTTSVACAVGQCPAGTIFGSASQYVVCRYSPPGNYAGQFAQNVGRHV
ncbi:CAP domain-containing protein [Mucidula mucida]|nr:CAP domain-containing protein [Mucidula mucida]